MSTARKRQQLNLDEVRQLRWLLGGALALLAVWSVFHLDVDAWATAVAGTVLVPLTCWRPGLPARWAGWMPRLAFPAALGVFVYELYFGGEVFPAVVRLGVILVVYRAINYRRRRDDLQLILLGLFLIVAAGVVTVSPLFALQITAFAGCALGMLMAITLTETAAGGATGRAGGGAPEWARQVDWRRLAARVRAASDWRVVALGGALFAGLVGTAGLLFMAMPRFQLENSLFLDRLMPRKSSSGFTDTLAFGEVSEIQKDNAVAMSVDVPDRSRMPAQLYWRMVVLDEYRDKTFRMSPGLRESAFGPARAESRVRGTERAAREPAGGWTFYIEPGVGRFLPLLGGYRELIFAERQSVRASASLRLVMLEREPQKMNAYRVEGMTGGAVLPELKGGEARGGREAMSAAKRPTFLELGLSEADRARLDGRVAEITGGVVLSPAAFVQRASAWLGARHRYALQMALPKGEGDPLVRWLVSGEPGHCELFAGSLVLLARAAGHPARVVSGYVGGTWNQEFLMVRNSDAHAWCEVYDGNQAWMRVDPTTAAGGGTGSDPLAALTAGGARPSQGGWSDRLDRLRLLWYRRIVNFDQRDQMALMQSLKVRADGLGQQLQVTVQAWGAVVRGWVAGPWNTGRVVVAGGVMAALGVIVWLLRMARRWSGGVWPWRRREKLDPARRLAGRWLERVTEMGGVLPAASTMSEEYGVLRERLERLRYGPKVTWGEVGEAAREVKRFRSRARRRR